MLRTAGHNSIYVRTLLVASCLGLLDDATFLAEGLVTRNADDAHPGSSFMKNRYRRACLAALAKWRDVVTTQSTPTLDTAQALLDLSLPPGSTAAVSGATSPAQADHDTPADTDAVSGVESPSRSVDEAAVDLHLDGGAPPSRRSHPTAAPDVSSAAEPFCHHLLTSLWRAVDLNENEQCGKRVRVFYAGRDNRW